MILHPWPRSYNVFSCKMYLKPLDVATSNLNCRCIGDMMLRVLGNILCENGKKAGNCDGVTATAALV